MRTIQVSEVIENIKEMCIEANHYLSEDMDCTLKKPVDKEQSHLEKKF